MSMNVYMDLEGLDKSSIVKSSDAMFDTVKDTIKITKAEKYIMKAIDGSEYISDTNMKTKYNEIVDLSRLSTGCKTAILVNLFPNKIINCIEAGSNAVNIILRFKTGNILLPLAPFILRDYPVDAYLHVNGKIKHYTSAIELTGGMIDG